MIEPPGTFKLSWEAPTSYMDGICYFRVKCEVVNSSKIYIKLLLYFYYNYDNNKMTSHQIMKKETTFIYNQHGI